jgi:phosphate transport system substrate-binding protein
MRQRKKNYGGKKLREMTTKEQAKFIIGIVVRVLAGIGVSILAFWAFLYLLLFWQHMTVLWIALLVFYPCAILFLILKKSVFLCVSLACALTASAVVGYAAYIHNVPKVGETEIAIEKYAPFNEEGTLALLGETADFALTENLPVLDGATALYPVYAAFATAVYPKDVYDSKDSAVLCGKTAGAYKNLLEGKADIIFCAAPSEEQQRQFAEKGIAVNFVPIGKEAFVFFVHKANRVGGVTIKDIQNIYAGKIKNWKELDGANKKIKAYQRPNNSGSQTALKKMMGDIPLETPPKENVSDFMGGIIEAVTSYRNFSNAIGFSFLHFSTAMVQNNQIKLLAVNNVYPSKESIQDGGYPLCDTFYAAYIQSDDTNKNVEPFIAWILSRQGQELIEKSGYVPVRN